MRPKEVLTILVLCSWMILHAEEKQASAVNEILSQLPECSSLRPQLERGSLVNGNEEPYMEMMRKYAVKRAFFQATAVWQDNKPQDVRFVQRLYFKKYDGPDAQITDPHHLESIRSSGLEELLTKIVTEKIQN